MGIIKIRHFFLFDAGCKGELMPENVSWKNQKLPVFQTSLSG